MDDWNYDKGKDDKGKGKEKDKDKDKGKGKEKDKGKGKEKDAQDEDLAIPRLVPSEEGRSYVPGPGARLATDADDQLYIVDPANQTIMKVVDAKGKDARAAYEERRAQQAALIKQLMKAAVKEAKRSLSEDGQVDGEATETRGPCDCGFRHWCDGREVDFVYPIETSKGTKILGYSLTDNVYDIAEKFVMKHDLARNSLNHSVYIQQIANSILEATSDKWKPNIDKKPAEKESTWDPTKAQVFRGNGMAHYNKEKGIFEGTMYPPLDSEVVQAERKKKEDTVKANQERLEEERRLKEVESKSIQAQIKRDQDEKEAERRYRAQLQQIHSETNPAASFVKKKRVVDEGGNVKYVDDNEPDIPQLMPSRTSRSPKSKKQKSESGPATLNSLRSGAMDDSSDEDSDESDSSELEDPMADGLPTMEQWNTEMVYNCLRLRGEQKTRQALRDSGFEDQEVGKILSISLSYALNRARARKQYEEDKKDRKARNALMKMQRAMMLGMAGGGMMDRERDREREKEKPPPSFAGHGHRLTDTPKPVETPPSTDGAQNGSAASLSTYKIDFNPAAPKANIRVRGPSGTITVDLNLTHTVRQLFDHLRTISNLMANATIKLHLPPAQAIEESDLTIQEAKLGGAAVILKL